MLFLLQLTLGCADRTGIKTVPVTGHISVDGEPLSLERAIVVFKPAKGNPTDYEPFGVVDKKGNYTLSISSDKKGAPLGWYKVIVGAYEVPGTPQRRNFTPVKSGQLLVNPKYGDPNMRIC
jgi:hypothetical protein